MNQNSNKITNKNIMVENINRLLYQKNWSIRQLADEAELPYESVKKSHYLDYFKGLRCA